MYATRLSPYTENPKSEEPRYEYIGILNTTVCTRMSYEIKIAYRIQFTSFN